jgi:transposase
MPAVSEFTKAKIVTLHQRGMSYGQISTNLGLSKGTIHAIMRKWEHTGTVVRRNMKLRDTNSFFGYYHFLTLVEKNYS